MSRSCCTHARGTAPPSARSPRRRFGRQPRHAGGGGRKQRGMVGIGGGCKRKRTGLGDTTRIRLINCIFPREARAHGNRTIVNADVRFSAFDGGAARQGNRTACRQLYPTAIRSDCAAADSTTAVYKEHCGIAAGGMLDLSARHSEISGLHIYTVGLTLLGIAALHGAAFDDDGAARLCVNGVAAGF